MTKPSWDERIERAEELAEKYAFAAEVLKFYKDLAGFQKNLYAHLQSSNAPKTEKNRKGVLEEELDLALLLPQFHNFLFLVKQIGPVALAQLADELVQEGQGRWENLLTTYWRANGEAGTQVAHGRVFFARAFLQPVAEYLADNMDAELPRYGQPTCPRCGKNPQVGVLRPEGHGAKRSFVCSLCATEWDYRRIVCPACKEDRFEKLSVYTASEFEHVRIEACETCKRYIKTVDLTKNGLAIPVVDELATTPLNLWAQEKGYTKVELNLLGL